MVFISLLIGVAAGGLINKQECKKGLAAYSNARPMSEPVLEKEVRLTAISTEEALVECRESCCMESNCRGIAFWSQEEKSRKNLQKEKCRLMLAPFGPSNVLSGQKGLRHETLAEFDKCSGEADDWIHEHRLKHHQTFVYSSFIEADAISEDECRSKCCNREDCFGVSYYEREEEQCKLWWVPLSEDDGEFEWQGTGVAVRHYVNPAMEKAYKEDPLTYVEWPEKRKRFIRTEERREAIQADAILKKFMSKSQKRGKRAVGKDGLCTMKASCTECTIESNIEQDVGVISQELCLSVCDKVKRCKAVDFVRVTAEDGHCVLKTGDLGQTSVATATEVLVKHCKTKHN